MDVGCKRHRIGEGRCSLWARSLCGSRGDEDESENSGEKEAVTTGHGL